MYYLLNLHCLRISNGAQFQPAPWPFPERFIEPCPFSDVEIYASLSPRTVAIRVSNLKASAGLIGKVEDHPVPSVFAMSLPWDAIWAMIVRGSRLKSFLMASLSPE
jgi:hypothetical protein